MDKAYKIDVMFRKWPDGTIDALFPYEAEFNYSILSYSIIGQHCSADYDHVLRLTKLASEVDYKALLSELTNHVGYEVTIIKRVNRDKMLDAWYSLNRSRIA